MLSAAHRFQVSLFEPVGKPRPIAAFTEAAGLPLHFSDGIHAQKIGGIHKTTDVTLKRGVVDSGGLQNWLAQVRDGSLRASDVLITQLNPSGQAMLSWRLRNTVPRKFTGPGLTAKGNDVAIEELVLSTESIQWEPPH